MQCVYVYWGGGGGDLVLGEFPLKNTFHCTANNRFQLTLGFDEVVAGEFYIIEKRLIQI